MEAKRFVNYYEVLRVGPGASQHEIERSFRYLALRYHPDNQATGDRSQFDAILEANSALKDEGRRAQYHQDHPQHLPPFLRSAEDEAGEARAGDAIGAAGAIFVDGVNIDRDVDVQNSLLTLLYLRRRRNVGEPGIGDAELALVSGCPPEHLDFHLWYLKAKGWVAPGEDGLLAITIDGVDRAAAIYKEFAQRLITDQT